jgi:glycosyltransferase involved in cell wall biosynthesis
VKRLKSWSRHDHGSAFTFGRNQLVKIVMVSRYPQQAEKPRGGVEAVTVTLANALAELGGDSVQVVTLERDQSILGDINVSGVQVRRLLRSNWPFVLDLNFGPSRRRLAATLNELEPSVVHFHETWGLGCLPTRCPQVFTVHGFDSANIPAGDGKFSFVRSKIWKMAETRGFARTKHIISISPYVTKQIRPHTRATIHEIDNPVDPGFFAVERKEEAGRVLCVGWVSARKNTLGSVRAFAKAFHAGKARKLVIAGTAPDKAYLATVETEIAKENLNGAVEFLGQVNRQQLQAELSRASVSLLPSLQENAPMAVAESMAAGVPVITSNRCGMPYMVEDNKSGFLIEPTDEPQIAERLTRLLGNAELRRGMAVRSLEIAKERFHPAEVARKTMRVYQGIIEQRIQASNGVAAPQVSA